MPQLTPLAIDFIGADDASVWNEYVANHPQGTIFHTAEMVDVYAATPQHQPFARAAVNADGKIVALLVAVRIVTVSGFASSLASRSVFFAEPLCDDSEEGVEALVRLIELHDQHMQGNTLFSEVRPIGPPGREKLALERCGYEYRGYLNYIVNLSQGKEVLWSNLKKSCRQNINRSRRKNVIVKDGTTTAGIKTMYPLIQSSYEHAQVPLADIGLFHAALELLPPGVVQVRVVSYQDRPVAAGIVLVYKGLIYAWYGGTSRQRGITPFDDLTWDEIEWGCNHQQLLYDFGGAGWPDEDYGPRKFKAKFGGKLVNYGRYRKVYSAWKFAVAKTSFRVLRSVVAPHSSK